MGVVEGIWEDGGGEIVTLLKIAKHLIIVPFVEGYNLENCSLKSKLGNSPPPPLSQCTKSHI